MTLTIENIDKLAIISFRTNAKCMAWNTHPDTYEFIVRHRRYTGEFRYTILREFNDKKFVGTFRHPYGSYRYDCYEMDLLDPQSFLEFLDGIIKEWAVKYKVTC